MKQKYCVKAFLIVRFFELLELLQHYKQTRQQVAFKYPTLPECSDAKYGYELIIVDIKMDQIREKHISNMAKNNSVKVGGKHQIL